MAVMSAEKIGATTVTVVMTDVMIAGTTVGMTAATTGMIAGTGMIVATTEINQASNRGIRNAGLRAGVLFSSFRIPQLNNLP